MIEKTAAAAVLAGMALVAGACGDSSPSESAIEEILEQAAGENADIDLSDGEINIQTEEGQVQIDIDDEDGSFEMSVDGSTVIDAQVDEEGDAINIQTEGGEANIDVGEDGEGSIEVTGEDGGSFDMSAAEGELPEDWPSAVPTPDGLAIEGSSTLATGDDVVYTVTGKVDAGWAESYAAEVESAGFSETSRFETPESVNLLFQSDDWAVNIFANDDGSGQWDVVVSVNTANF